jgi:hypothetical protein
MMRTATVLVSLMLSAQAAWAQPLDEGANSVNLSPLGVASGTYGLNYEHLLDGTHGFLVEGAYAKLGGDDASSTSTSGNVGYRWHWRGQQSSGFLGLTMGYGVGSGEATVTYEGETSTWDVDVTTFKLVPNIGKRWAWDFGLNITIRGGIGYAQYEVSTSSSSEAAQEAVKDVNDVLEWIPVGIDGELSVGWIF